MGAEHPDALIRLLQFPPGIVSQKQEIEQAIISSGIYDPRNILPKEGAVEEALQGKTMFEAASIILGATTLILVMGSFAFAASSGMQIQT